MKKTAIVSECGKYRYALTREWDDSLPRVCFIMLNPSVADADLDDPTIRKCIGFAQRWGYGSIEVVNVYAWRATDPKNLPKDKYMARGPENAKHLDDAGTRTEDFIAAWGVHAGWIDVLEVGRHIERARCLGRTKDGAPRHPLMLAYTTPREPYWPRNEK